MPTRQAGGQAGRQGGRQALCQARSALRGFLALGESRQEPESFEAELPEPMLPICSFGRPFKAKKTVKGATYADTCRRVQGRNELGKYRGHGQEKSS